MMLVYPTSSDAKYLNPEFARRLNLAGYQWERDMGVATIPMIISTYRTETLQQRLWEQYHADPEHHLPASPPGHSLHNWLEPEGCCAADFSFRNGGARGRIVTHKDRPDLYRKLGHICVALGLEWGGDWGHADPVHVQAKRYTWEMAKAGKPPVFPALS